MTRQLGESPGTLARGPGSGRAGVAAGLLIWAVLAATVQADPVTLEYEGRELQGRYEPPPPGEPVVLMVHGTLAHADMEIMTAFREVLAEEGWGALAVSLSYGETARSGMYPCESLHGHLASEAGAEIAAWLAWLKRRGAERIVLLGHSRGALQVAEYAAGRPLPGVAAIILVAPPLAEPASMAAGYEARYGVALDGVLAKAREAVAAGQPDAPLEVPGFLHCPDARVTAESFLSYYGPEAPGNLTALIARSPVPVLVIAGSEDAVSPGLPAAIRPSETPLVRVVEVAGADHFFRDLYAYDVVESIQGFVGPSQADGSGGPGR